MSTRIFLLLALTLIVTVSSFKMNTFTKNSGKIIEDLRKNSRFNQQNLLNQPVNLKNQLVNITNYEFISLDDMQRWTHLNKTFKDLSQRGSVFSTIWKVSANLTYNIDQAIPKYTCQDKNQKAEVFPNNKVLVDGVFPKATLDFKWKIKTGTTIRQGIARASSDMKQVGYVIQFKKDDSYGFISNQILDYIKPQFSNFKLLSVQPQISQQQKIDLITLINNASTAVTIIQQIIDDITQRYPYYIQSSFWNIHSLTYRSKNYQYYFTQLINRCNVNTEKIPTFFKSYGKLGFVLGYTNSLIYLKNEQFKLIQTPENLPVETYGGKQQFTSFQFYKNFISYLIQQNNLASLVSKGRWATKEFKFFASDLFSIFSNLNTNFENYDQIIGVCYAFDKENVTVVQATNSTFNVTFNTGCNFKINQKDIADIDLSFQLEIFGAPNKEKIDFWIKSLTVNPNIKDNYEFKLINRTALVKIIRQVSYRLYESRIVGSDWDLPVAQNKPLFTVKQAGTYLTDLDSKPKSQQQ